MPRKSDVDLTLCCEVEHIGHLLSWMFSSCPQPASSMEPISKRLKIIEEVKWFLIELTSQNIETLMHVLKYYILFICKKKKKMNLMLNSSL